MEESWLDSGYKHIWLPYTQMLNQPKPLLAAKGAQDCKIFLADGREIIDGTSSWWSACHGYRNPHIINAIAKQANSLPHIMFTNFANEPAYRLAERLARVTGLDRVFFSDSGSTAVEVAMKIAVQYFYNKEQSNKSKFLSFKNAYHGDTMGCMSIAACHTSMHKKFSNYLPKHYVANIPESLESTEEFAELESILQKEDVAAVIIEPLVQCAGGMKFHHANVLKKIYEITKKHQIIFIADEVATGFGKIGKMFASQATNIQPDIMVLGKALTGGTCSLGATIVSEKIFQAFLGTDLDKALMHGPTFMGNALACTAANASLDLFKSEPRLEQVKKIGIQMQTELEKCKEFSRVRDVRIMGAIGVVELDITFEEILFLREKTIDMGVWLRPFNDVIYIIPPFIISEVELSCLTSAVEKLISML